MTNKTLTALTIRVAGFYLFTKIFDHFGSYFFSIYLTATMARFDSLLVEPVDKIYFTGTFLTLANIALSIFLIVKADWISNKLIKTDSEIKTELTPNSLVKVILISVSVIWLAMTIYLLPDFIEYSIELVNRIRGHEVFSVSRFSPAKYLLRLAVAVYIILRIEKISNWITLKI